jgi:hypothetical protein
MSTPLVSQRRANATFNGILLIGLGILFWTEAWWPGIVLVIGAALIVRQSLRGRVYDAVLSAVIFGGLFVGALSNWSFSFLIPVLFTSAGLYLLFTEWWTKHDRVGDEKVEDMTQEIHDDDHPQ